MCDSRPNAVATTRIEDELGIPARSWGEPPKGEIVIQMHDEARPKTGTDD
jgi:hypothetical protein